MTNAELRSRNKREIANSPGKRPSVSVDVLAAGPLQLFLTSTLGEVAARSLLQQLAFARGWQVATSTRTQIADPLDFVAHRARLHPTSLEHGLISALKDKSSQAETDYSFATSLEADQHCRGRDVSDGPTCWVTSGFMSGYLSFAHGAVMIVREDRCLAYGDSECHFVARSAKDANEDFPGELAYFSSEQLMTSLSTALEGAKSPSSNRSRKTISNSKSDLPHHSQRKRSPATTSASPLMREALDIAVRVAQTDTTVLITGESGTGKERVARLIHENSPRADGPFIAINCGAIAESLLDSELFGHVRGAFTGAIQTRTGIFEAANHGTLLLDEIGEISLSMQVKLLRVLQEREVRRVGDSQSRPFDVRILAATNSDLAQHIKNGSFREDLYYRIRIVELQIPPLRNRPEDIIDLARILLAESAERMKRDVIGFSPAVETRLLGYDWPGNVRELENTVERAIALCRSSQVELEDLPHEIRNLVPHFQPLLQSVRPLQDISKDYILAALNLNDGNQASTAKQLGIGSATLYRKLKRYGYHPLVPTVELFDESLP